ncbi:MAG: cytidylate kinase [Flavobacteriaceae bacterium]|nr:cytidylate kinase [Flavobacteriaceae bacterium]
MSKDIISIDGTSSTGKSTIARRIANKLNFTYIDSGSMYRAVTYFCLKNGIIFDNKIEKKKLNDKLDKILIDFKLNPKNSQNEIRLNNNFIDSKLRSLEIADHVSKIAKQKNVRDHILKIQHQLSKKNNIVMDGRDIGSVVFPNAKYKFFLTASSKTRAKRRYDEMKKNGLNVSYNDVLENIILRDKDDSTRTYSPLKIPDDALTINTENLSLDELEKVILDFIHNN